jgi:hypothetical protein
MDDSAEGIPEEPDIWENDIFMDKMKKAVEKNLKAPTITKGPPVPQIPGPPKPPASPSSVGFVNTKMQRVDWDPDMAAADMARDLIFRMGTPTILTQRFVVWHGIVRALNDSDENPTGLDTSLRLEIYDHAAKNSVNVNGQYFFEVWKYLNRPKIIVTQPGMMPGSAMEDEQPSLGRRIINKITGGGNNGKPNNPQ